MPVSSQTGGVTFGRKNGTGNDFILSHSKSWDGLVRLSRIADKRTDSWRAEYYVQFKRLKGLVF